jgi:hypothetical protein
MASVLGERPELARLVGQSIERISNDEYDQLCASGAEAVVDDGGIIRGLDDGQGPQGYEFVLVLGGKIVYRSDDPPGATPYPCATRAIQYV